MKQFSSEHPGNWPVRVIGTRGVAPPKTADRAPSSLIAGLSGEGCPAAWRFRRAGADERAGAGVGAISRHLVSGTPPNGSGLGGARPSADPGALPPASLPVPPLHRGDTNCPNGGLPASGGPRMSVREGSCQGEQVHEAAACYNTGGARSVTFISVRSHQEMWPWARSSGWTSLAGVGLVAGAHPQFLATGMHVIQRAQGA